jgi:hypothetical protein
MSVDFQNGFVLGITALGKYIYQAKSVPTPPPMESYTINLRIILNDVEVYSGNGTITNSLQQALNVQSKDWLMKKLKGWASPLTYRNINGINYETQEAFTNLMLTDNSSAIENRITGNLINTTLFSNGVQPSDIGINFSSIAWSFIISEALTFRSVYINHAGYTTPDPASTEPLHHVELMAILPIGQFKTEFAGYGDWMYYIDDVDPTLLQRRNISTGILETISSLAPGSTSASMAYFNGSIFIYWDSSGNTYSYNVATDTWTTYTGITSWTATDGVYGYSHYYDGGLDSWFITRVRFSDGATTNWDTGLTNSDLSSSQGSRIWIADGIIHIHNYHKHYSGTFNISMTFQNFRGAVSNLSSLWDDLPMYVEFDGVYAVVYKFLLDEDDTNNSVHWLLPSDIVKADGDTMSMILTITPE